MSYKNARKFGFIAALSMLVGSVVGIGIFFKNGSVIKAVEGNAPTALLAWIIGGMLSLAAAISFSSLGAKIKTAVVHGLPGWSENLGGRKFGYFVRFNLAILYLGVLTSVLGFFVSELFFMFLSQTGAISSIPPVWVHALVGFFFSVVGIAINILSTRTSGVIQVVTVVLKFIPLALALIVGIVLPNTHNTIHGTNYFANGSSFTIKGLIAALPAILFAYDAFLNVATLKDKTKGGEKTISKVVFIGLLMATTLYTLLSVSSLLHGGTISALLSDSLPNSIAKGLNIFVFLFLFISGYGVLNGLCAAFVANIEQVVKTNTLFGTKSLKEKFGDKKAIVFNVLIIFIFGYLFSVVPAIFLNTDKYVDAVSNFPTLLFFVIYAIVICLFLVKTKNNKMLIKISGWIFVVGVSLIILYLAFYGYTIKLYSGDFTKTSTTGVGLFAPDGKHQFTDLDFHLIMICYLLLFGGLSFINKVLSKRFENNEVDSPTQIVEQEKVSIKTDR